LRTGRTGGQLAARRGDQHDAGREGENGVDQCRFWGRFFTTILWFDLGAHPFVPTLAPAARGAQFPA
jgi:hypothetical protein